MASIYVMVPRADGPFKGLDPLARMCFGLIWDRWQLSTISNRKKGGSFVFRIPDELRSRYRDSPVSTYCVYTHAELAAEIGCSERTARRCVADLRAAGLVDVFRRGVMGASCFTIPSDVRAYMPKDRLRERLLEDE